MKKINKIGKNLAVFTVIGGVLISSFPINTYALTKNETVYSKLDYNGATRSIIVNEQLINSKKANKIEDYSELKNILNLNNDSEYEINNGKITWNANGNDIFYQGTTDKELPISTTITYKLNGETKELKDILGKKGNITINIKYVNHDKHGSLYTPFVITMGTIIDSKNNSSISVTNGKVVDNGSKNIIIGLAAPGLYESLNLKELKGLDTITISYYTEKFELASIYSVVTPKLIESSDLKVFDKLDTLSSSVNQLQSNMNSIEQGAKDVSKGSNDLKNGLQNSIENLNKTNKDNALTDSQVEDIKNQTVSSIKGIYTDTYKQEIANSAYQKVLESMASSSDQTVSNYVKNSISTSFTNYLKNINGITLIENPYFNECNNISSLFVARDYIEDAIILDGDQIIYNKDILFKNFDKSGYSAFWTEEDTKEWLLTVGDDNIISCSRTGGNKGWQLCSVSRWNKTDAQKLKKHIEIEFLEKNNKDIFWDDVALFCYPAEYDLKIYKINKKDIIEIDNLDELKEIDDSYKEIEV